VADSGPLLHPQVVTVPDSRCMREHTNICPVRPYQVILSKARRRTDGRTALRCWSEFNDGQTNGIKFIPFVCPSSMYSTTTPRALARSPRIGVRDGQTNGKFYPIRLSVKSRDRIVNRMRMFDGQTIE
jgi:hypothetical protein